MLLVLIVVSLVWAFSFGLIKGRLAGIDPSLVAALRLIAALVVFLPVFRPRGVGTGRLLRLAVIGAVQFGLVYLLYLGAYPYLKAYEVALFTITTPIFVALIDAAFARRWTSAYLVAAILSILGAGVVVWSEWATGPNLRTLTGFLMVQASNLCFAAGQVAWRWERRKIDPSHSDASLFAAAYAGGLLTTVVFQLPGLGALKLSLTAPQLWVIAYLGIVATGLCFFLWNYAASRVNAGVLAAANNAKVPLGVAVSLLVFHEHAAVGRLIVSLALMTAAVLIAQRAKDKARA